MSDSAVELLNAALAGRDRVERFVQEIRTTAALSPPPILPLFDSGTGSRPPWRPRGGRWVGAAVAMSRTTR